MNNEIELKLAVSSASFSLLERHLQQFTPLEHGSIFLGNTYYDYSDHFLAKQKMGLRIRQEEQTFTLTLKTDGTVAGGLHNRPEYNLSLIAKETPTNEQLRTLYPFEQLPNEPLQIVFSTDFNRTFWLIPFRHSHIEVAFDQGKIIAGEREEPICEIEFELKKGRVKDLFDFVETLPFTQNIYFSSASKAKRGYRLARPFSVTDWLNKWRDFLQAQREANATNFPTPSNAVLDSMSDAGFNAVPDSRFNAVLAMEQTLVEETLAVPIAFFSQDFMKTVERVGAFFNLYHYYDENPRIIEAMAKSKDVTDWTDILKSNQYFLSEIQSLIRFHSECKDNVKTLEKLTMLLQSRAYFDRMIQLMRLAV